LNFHEERRKVFTELYVTANKDELWFLNFVNKDLTNIILGLKKSIYWLTNIIKDCDKPEEERKLVSFDVEAIKENITPRNLGLKLVKEFQGKEFYLCPLHNEKTPSFCWNKDEKYYKCFGCGEAGDIIDLYMKINHCDFRQACRELQYIV